MALHQPRFGKVSHLPVVELSEERLLNVIDKLDVVSLAHSLDLGVVDRVFRCQVLSVLPLLPYLFLSQGFEVVSTDVLWIDLLGDGIVGRELRLNHLILKEDGELDRHVVAERVTIVHLHVVF